MRCLVLGGSGFIGTALSRELTRAGCIVRTYSRDPFVADRSKDQWWQKVEWLYGDFSNAGALRAAMKDIQVVFHLISTTMPASSNQNVAHDLTSNVLATIQMLELAKENQIKKVIFISSGGTVYGIPSSVPVNEHHETDPICAYGVHKLAIEKYLHLYGYLWNIGYGILRVSNPYGVGQPIDRPQGVIASFLHKAIRRIPLEVWGDGSVTRDYLYIDDLIDACIRFLTYEGPYRVMNIGAGRGYTLLEVISTIEKIIGERLQLKFQEGRSFDVPVNILDIRRAETELGWRPSVDLETGIRLTLESSKHA